MRFLVDESLQRRVADLLITAGHDALHVSNLDLSGASDEAVLDAAARGGRILVTADTDFGNLLALSGDPRPSVVLLRRPGRRPELRAAAILGAVEAIGDRVEAGAIVVVGPQRIRIRDLPIG